MAHVELCYNEPHSLPQYTYWQLKHTRTLQSPRKKKSVKADTYLSEVQGLTDEELKEELKRFGKDCGPITDSTRLLYQRSLAKSMAERATGKCEVDKYTSEKAS